MQLYKLIVTCAIVFTNQVLGDFYEDELLLRGKREAIMDVIIDKVQRFVKDGSKFLNVSSLEPYHNSSIKIHIDGDHLKIRGELVDVTVEGLSNFDVPNYNFNIMKAKSSMDIIFPNITSYGRYNLSYNSKSRNAIGKYSITLQDLTFTAFAKFALFAKDGVTFTKFDNVNVETVSLTTEGEYNKKPSNLKIVKDTSKGATEFIKKYQVVDFFLKKSLTFINQKLAGKSLWALRKFFKAY